MSLLTPIAHPPPEQAPSETARWQSLNSEPPWNKTFDGRETNSYSSATTCTAAHLLQDTITLRNAPTPPPRASPRLASPRVKSPLAFCVHLYCLLRRDYLYLIYFA